MTVLTQQKLKELLRYEPDEGVFFRLTYNKNDRNGRGFIGDKVGSYDKHGYIVIKIQGKLYKAHRLAWLYMTGKYPEKQIDHINNIRDDNRWLNLRQANNQENHRNRGPKRNNTSGYKGVTFSKRKKGPDKWKACIHNGEKNEYLGTYNTPEDAFDAYCNAAKKYHGDYARTK